MEATHITGSAADLAAARAGGPTDPSLDPRLRRGIIDTEVSRPVAAALIAAFLFFIYAIPVSQAILERVADEESSLLALFDRTPTRQNLRQFEHDLEQASFAKSFVQPRIQWLLSRFGRVGNKRALIGRDGWLYYTPGLIHLAGPSFVDADAIERRERAAHEGDELAVVHADPRPAIFAFRDMLARRGIKLVLFPVPDKTMLQPMQLHGRVDGDAPRAVARNLGWSRFVRELKRRGVALFDPAPSRLVPGQAPLFLVQDTHWTPAWMQRVARDLARFVTRVGALPPARAPRQLHAVTQHSERVGDLVDMLKLPDDQALFRPQVVTTQRVQDSSGSPWEPDATADVLVLGDSFTNVFSMDTMGWGEAAGLAPHLELALGRPVDVIALNDSGAFATRQALSRELSAGEDRLAGKRVVIWEFAVRELSVGDWKPIDWQAADGRGSSLVAGASQRRILVTGAAGVLGLRLCARLLEAGESVRGLVLPNDPQRARLQRLGAEPWEGDICDPASLHGICDGIDTVYHLAAIIISSDRSAFRRINRDGTAHIVATAAAACVRHFIYVSSASVTYPTRTPYAQSKLEAELLVANRGAFEHTIVRPTLVYDRRGGQELLMFLDYLRRFPVVPFIGPGTALKRPVWAEDIVEGLARVAGNPVAYGKTYNFSGGESIAMLDFARLLLRHHAADRPFVHVPVAFCRAAARLLSVVMDDPPLTSSAIAGVINDADLDPAEAMRDLGYRPIGVRDGFERCFATASRISEATRQRWMDQK